MQNPGKGVGQNEFGGAATLDLLGGEVLTFRRQDEITLVEGDALLVREAHGCACRRAARIIRNRLWRARNLCRNVGLPQRQAASPQHEAPWCTERLNRHTVRNTFDGELLF